MSFLYFAYGSNMLTARLQDRCPSAKNVGVATAANHKLEFSKKSKDGSGKGALVHCERGSSVSGVVFEIKCAELGALDRAEGCGHGYEREDKFLVQGLSGEKLETTTYLPSLKPYNWYLALVIAGAIENNLPEADIKRLKETKYVDDKEVDRDSRKTAIEVLNAAGHTDWQKLLK